MVCGLTNHVLTNMYVCTYSSGAARFQNNSSTSSSSENHEEKSTKKAIKV